MADEGITLEHIFNDGIDGQMGQLLHKETNKLTPFDPKKKKIQMSLRHIFVITLTAERLLLIEIHIGSM